MQVGELVEPLQRAVDARRLSVQELCDAASALETTKSHVRAAKVSGAIGTTAGSIATVVGSFLLAGAAAATPVGWAGLGVGVAGTMVGVGASVAESSLGHSRMKRLKEVMDMDSAAVDALVADISAALNTHHSESPTNEAFDGLIKFCEAVLYAKASAAALEAEEQLKAAAQQQTTLGSRLNPFRKTRAHPDTVLSSTTEHRDTTIAIDTVGSPEHVVGGQTSRMPLDLDLNADETGSKLVQAGGAAAGVAGSAAKAGNLSHVTKVSGAAGLSLPGMQVLSGAASAVFLPYEVYRLTYAAIEMHENQPPKAAEKIRSIAGVCQDELEQLEQLLLSAWLISRCDGVGY